MSHPWSSYRNYRRLKADEKELSQRVRLHARKAWRVVHGRRMLVTVYPYPPDIKEEEPK